VWGGELSGRIASCPLFPNTRRLGALDTFACFLVSHPCCSSLVQDYATIQLKERGQPRPLLSKQNIPCGWCVVTRVFWSLAKELLYCEEYRRDTRLLHDYDLAELESFAHFPRLCMDICAATPHLQMYDSIATKGDLRLEPARRLPIEHNRTASQTPSAQ
jgi:hypothetical protein